MTPTRDQWSSRVGFILAAAGSAIGLGNLWKFPYITWHNEGGAFVLVYLICILLVGLPIMMAEILIGRRTQKSAVGALREAAGPAWAWVGGLGVLTGFVILGYYSVVAGWTLHYFARCLDWSFNGFNQSADLGAAFNELAASWKSQIALSASFMIATISVVYFGIGRGIERLTRALMPVLFVILLLLLGSALTTSGAGRALEFIFKPNFSELPWTGVLEALGHSFFTLSLGMGAMITYGSYLKRDASVVRSSMMVVVLDTLIAICATIILFSVIFSDPAMPDQVGKSTVGMLFVSLPKLLYTVVPLGSLLAPLFYILVGFAALTSTVSLLEVVVAYFIDQRGMNRARATLLCGGTIFVITCFCGLSFGAWAPVTELVIPYFGGGKAGLFSGLDHLASNWLLPVGGFFITLTAGWIVSRDFTHGELIDETTPRWFRYGAWRFFIRYVAPVAVATIIYKVIDGWDFS